MACVFLPCFTVPITFNRRLDIRCGEEDWDRAHPFCLAAGTGGWVTLSLRSWAVLGSCCCSVSFWPLAPNSSRIPLSWGWDQRTGSFPWSCCTLSLKLSLRAWAMAGLSKLWPYLVVDCSACVLVFAGQVVGGCAGAGGPLWSWFSLSLGWACVCLGLTGGNFSVVLCDPLTAANLCLAYLCSCQGGVPAPLAV